jgi:hypothetical protein
MDRNKQITAAAILTLAIAGCTVGESPTPSDTTTPAPGASPTQPTSSAPANQPGSDNVASNGQGANNQPVGIQPFNNPLVTPKSNSTPTTPSITTASNLIQPTNVEQRREMLITGRRDPFGQIIAPTVLPPMNPTPSTSTRGLVPPPPLPKAPKPRVENKLSSPPKSNLRPPAKDRQLPKNPVKPKSIQPPTIKPVKPVAPKSQPAVIPNTTLANVLPPVQEPEAAKAVGVTGVIMIGREPKAIITVPNEPSRHVQVGQRLAGGVLVKRIEMNQGIEPVVILEQNGIEVVKKVGDKPADKTATTNTPQPATGNSV